jgi:GNAT superfamily N-acetyltransferase
MEQVEFKACREDQSIRLLEETNAAEILIIINAAAVAYRGVIPSDRWHNPYMSMEDLKAEMAAGVRFSGYMRRDGLIGVMGIQHARNVHLIRHAYVLPTEQGQGIGSALLRHICSDDGWPILIGTWQAASWAVRFYEGQGFKLVPEPMIAPLLETYWRVPARQVETSVVLARPTLSECEATQMIVHAQGHWPV